MGVYLDHDDDQADNALDTGRLSCRWTTEYLVIELNYKKDRLGD